jgi:hypothetical protein
VKKAADNDEDDPIAKSLKEREAAGGLSETTKARPATAVPTNRVAPAKPKEEEKKTLVIKKVVKPAAADNDEDDPIAKSLKEREAAGGITEVAKTRPVTAAVKPKGNADKNVVETKARP